MAEIQTATVLSSESAGDGFHMVVAEASVPHGALPATHWLAARVPGDALPFTGPWGSRFRLDDGEGPVGFFAAGSGISSIGAMVDACVTRGRPARLLWETPAPSMLDRIASWRAAGVDVEIGDRLSPRPDGALWWLAGHGARLDEVEALFYPPPQRIERY